MFGLAALTSCEFAPYVFESFQGAHTRDVATIEA